MAGEVYPRFYLPLDDQDEEDAELWRHFDDWDWDTVLQHIT
jgi:hypothetical protein